MTVLNKTTDLLNYIQSETGADEVSFKTLVEDRVQLFFVWYRSGPIQDVYCGITLMEIPDADEQYEANYLQYLIEKAKFQHNSLLKKEKENVTKEKRERC